MKKIEVDVSDKILQEQRLQIAELQHKNQNLIVENKQLKRENANLTSEIGRLIRSENGSQSGHDEID